MKFKRFDTISPFGQNVVSYEPPKEVFTESVTDDSFFVPSSEAIKGLSGALTEKEVQTYYDFPTGKDSGLKPPLSRRPGVDIAELSTSVRSKQEALKKQVKEAQEKQDFEQKLAEKFAPKPTEKTVSNTPSA